MRAFEVFLTGVIALTMAAEPVLAQNPASPDAKKKSAAKGDALFNGKDLTGWEEINFGGEGEVAVEDGEIVLGFGEIMTGIKYAGKAELPKTDYEVSLEAMKLDGSDFFCGLTFPVGDSFATFIVGGWGGAVVGISSIDGLDASENETANFMAFEKNRWYKIRVRVTENRLEAWIDDKQMVDADIEGRRINLRPGDIELCVPLGIASFQTRSALRNITVREVKE